MAKFDYSLNKVLPFRSRASTGLFLIGLIPLCWIFEIVFTLLWSLGLLIVFRELLDVRWDPVKAMVYAVPLALTPLLVPREKIMTVIVFTQTSDILQFLGGKFSRWFFGQIVRVLRMELANFKLQFKNSDVGFKSHKELAGFLEKSVKEFYLFEASPNKTIIGYVVGYWGCLIIFTYITSLLPWKVNMFWFALGCAGDLFASSIKRERGVKDFSRFLGEHGGVLDRFDSSIAVVHYYFWKELLLKTPLTSLR